jgi:hypothetical protein
MSEEAASKPERGELITLKNGAVYDRSKGRIVANPGGGTTAITQADASVMNKLRWEQYRQAAADAVQRATGGPTPSAGWGVIVERQTELAQDTEKGRSSTEAARFVGAAVGILGAEARAERVEGAPGGAGPVPLDTLRALLDDLRVVQELKRRLESQVE